MEPHAFQRIEERLTEDERTLVRARCEGLSQLFADRRDISIAVLVLRLKAQRNRAWGEVSNGDQVWAIVRGGRVKTVMLRRSTQPATADAMRVDHVVSDAV